MPISELPLSRIAPVLASALVAALLAWAFVIGRAAQAAVDAAETAEIVQEDRRFCVELGFEEQDNRYFRCTSGLAEIRLKQRERWDRTIP